jgi:hypothetical protein
MGRLGNYVIFVITTIVTIVTFVGFLTSESLKTWTRTHSEVIFYGLIFFFLATGASLNSLSEERKRNRQLRKATAHVEPSEHDRKLFQTFITMLPPDGPVIKWLKENFRPDAFSKKDFKGIEDALGRMRLQSLGFDDSGVGASYNQLREAMQKFALAIPPYMRNDPASPWLEIQPELDSESSKKAADEINEMHRELVEKYENFLYLAHQSEIDQ